METHAETVLIVEDNEDVAQLTRIALRIQGYDAFVASSRNDAVKFIVDDGMPDVIIMDWHMPGMSIEKFMLEMTSLSRGKPLPRIILSTAGQDADKVAKSLNIPEVLRKPFDPVNPLKQVDGWRSV
jgi:CheY-like chemotaxis protein